MKTADARERMIELEDHHDREYSMGEFVRWLLALDDDVDTVAAGMLSETQRARILAMRHYQRFGSRVAVGDCNIDCAVSFMQGVTFAAAALGIQPDGEPGT